MSCSQTLDFSIVNDQPMDSACFNSTDGFIYGVRGGRIYRCNAITGTISAFSDFNTRLLSPSSIAWDLTTNTLWAGGYNDPTAQRAVGNAIPAANFFSPRSIQKIDPASLSVSQNLDLDTFFPTTGSPNFWDWKQFVQAGVRELRSIGSSIFASIDNGNGGSSQISNFQLMFNPSNVAAYTINNQALVAGQTALVSPSEVWVPDATFPAIQQVDTSSSFSTPGFQLSTWSGGGPPATSHDFFPTAFEWSPEASAFFCTSQDVGSPGDGSWIYRISPAPAEVLRINTGHPNLNPVHIRRCGVAGNPNLGMLFIAGFGDNTVIILNPLSNGITVKTGFDLPYDFVFTATKSWAVQQGATSLREIV